MPGQNVRAFADRRGHLARQVSAGGNPAVAGWLELTPRKKVSSWPTGCEIKKTRNHATLAPMLPAGFDRTSFLFLLQKKYIEIHAT